MSAVQTIRKTVDSLDEIAGLIANPPSNAPIRQAIGNSGRRVCDAYANVRLVESLLIGPAATVIGLVCKPYFDQEGFDGPTLTGFATGQCAVAYNIVVTFIDRSRNCSNNAPSNSNGAQGTRTTNGVVGPLGEFRQVPGRVGCNGNFREYDFQIKNGAGDWVDLGQSGTSFPNDIYQTPADIVSVVFTRADGQPDECGPAIAEPGANPPPDPGAFPTGQEPGVNPDGDPFFFIPDLEDPEFGPVTLEDEPLGGPLEPAAPAGGDGLPGDPAAIADEAGEVTGGEDGEAIDFGEPPEGRIWVGCIVETSTGSGIGNIAGTGPESTVWPSVRANVALQYGSRYGTSQRINSRFHEVFRPNTSLVVTGCFLQVQPGSTSKVFPISALICPESPCGDD